MEPRDRPPPSSPDLWEHHGLLWEAPRAPGELLQHRHRHPEPAAGAPGLPQSLGARDPPPRAVGEPPGAGREMPPSPFFGCFSAVYL